MEKRDSFSEIEEVSIGEDSGDHLLSSGVGEDDEEYQLQDDSSLSTPDIQEVKRQKTFYVDIFLENISKCDNFEQIGEAFSILKQNNTFQYRVKMSRLVNYLQSLPL